MTKITKAMAKKLYDQGEAILIMPNRLRPNSYVWKQLASWTTKPSNDPSATFEKLCNIVFYYNCTPETGMDLVFYSKEVA